MAQVWVEHPISMRFTSSNLNNFSQEKSKIISLWLWPGKEKSNHLEICQSILHNKSLSRKGTDFTRSLFHLGEGHLLDPSLLHSSYVTQGGEGMGEG